MKRVLFLYDSSVQPDWLRETVSGVQGRYRITNDEFSAEFRQVKVKPVFVSGNGSCYIPAEWMRQHIGPLTSGEYAVILCLGKKSWSNPIKTVGHIEYGKWNNQTYLIHALTEPGRKYWTSGSKNRKRVLQAAETLFHELLHAREADLNRFGTVHANLDDLDAAARLLRDDKPASPATIALLEKLKATLQALLAKKQTGFTPPNGYAEIVAHFGNPYDADFERKNIVPFNLPYPLRYAGVSVTKSRAHRLAVPQFVGVLQELKEKGLDKHIQNYGGIYANRLQRTGNKLSTHAWGIAIDCEPQKYPLGSKKRFSPEVVEVFAKWGFENGARFAIPDPMHFQLARNY